MATAATRSNPHPHILVFPYPAQGHMLALLDLTHQLALHGLTITILVLNMLKTLATSNPPVAIISDFFLGWTQHLATRLQIPRLAFFSTRAFLVSVFDYIWNNVEKLYKRSDPDWEFVKDGLLANTKSWGYVLNSFDALEGEYVQWLKTHVAHDRVFNVGPLSLIGPDVSDRGNSGSSSDLNDQVMTWLNQCPDGSVVYVCFGSQKLLRKEQMEALASGLEKSDTRFIWVVKPGTTQQHVEGFGVVPDGFEQRNAGQGLVVKGWAPQALILNHKAVGGFLSHCGWNSVSEAIVGGVMMLAWPMEADQFVNARLLAMTEGGGMKTKAKDLKEKAFAAVSHGGSSMNDLVRFVKELGQLGSSRPPACPPKPHPPTCSPGANHHHLSVEHVKDLGNSGNLPIMVALGKLHDPLVEWFDSHSEPPVAIVSDFFIGWTQCLATRLQIPRLTFYSSEFGNLPGSPAFKQEHLPSLFKLYKPSDPDLEMIKAGHVANTKSWGCFINSFEDLEAEYVQWLKTHVGHNRVFSVGPLSLIGPDVSDRGNSGSVSEMNDQVLTWLDRCPDGSVVYVCFGSQKLLRKEQMEALANGLEKSATRFIWVVKSGTTQQQVEGFGVVPYGFEQRTAGQGHNRVFSVGPLSLIGPDVSDRGNSGSVSEMNDQVLTWLDRCPDGSVVYVCFGSQKLLRKEQMEALANGLEKSATRFIWVVKSGTTQQQVEGFGVVPYGFEQRTAGQGLVIKGVGNARVGTEPQSSGWISESLWVELGFGRDSVGVRECEGADSVPDSDELGRAIAEFMTEGGGMKAKAKDLKEKALAAVSHGESSMKDLDRFVEELGQLGG
ncbi:hypothetical protein GOBAR_DD30823 [Gossypium barbadense]|nr:hypothetical protein GOBAR_DD30823 [Gossypium barbadense]